MGAIRDGTKISQFMGPFDEQSRAALDHLREKIAEAFGRMIRNRNAAIGHSPNEAQFRLDDMKPGADGAYAAVVLSPANGQLGVLRLREGEVVESRSFVADASAGGWSHAAKLSLETDDGWVFLYHEEQVTVLGPELSVVSTLWADGSVPALVAGRWAFLQGAESREKGPVLWAINASGERTKLTNWAIKSLVSDSSRVIAEFAPDKSGLMRSLGQQVDGYAVVVDLATAQAERQPIAEVNIRASDAAKRDATPPDVAVSGRIGTMPFAIGGLPHLVEVTVAGPAGSVTWVRLDDTEQTYAKNLQGIVRSRTTVDVGWYYFGSDRVEWVQAPSHAHAK